ncbi:MAG: hypothetical protein WC494_02705 [Candidatus Pacearchaeota archaeon]
MNKIKLINSKFVKINAEFNPNFSGQTSAKMNIKILEIFPLKNKETFQAKYLFEVNYLDLGKISLEGSLFFSTDSRTLKELQKAWKENKIETPDYIFITNNIIQKASIKAIQIEEEMGFPIHLRLPRVDLKNNK